MNIAFDIETGDLPREVQIERVKAFRESREFVDEPEPVLKLGNAKKAETIERKKLEFEAELERWKAGKNDRYLKWQEEAADRERKHYDEKLKWARLNAAHSEMLCYSVVGEGIEQCVWSDGNEFNALRQLVNTIENALLNGHQVYGANVIGFDVPYLYRRAMVHGIACPHIVKHGYGGRMEIHKGVVDVLKVWQGPEWSSTPVIGLQALAHVFGIDGKTDPQGGATFAELAVEDRARAEAYSIRDSQIVWEVAQKMGLVEVERPLPADLPF